MQKAAADQGLECKIWAESVEVARTQVDQADVMLLGPQVRYLLSQMKKLGEEKGVPVDSINPVHYGMCNGTEVLKTALTLINKG